MPSQLGHYTLLNTLGTGATAKVKLAHSHLRGHVAVKMFKDPQNLNMVKTEIEAMYHLDHPNVLKLLDFSPESIVEREDGSTYPVAYIAIEAALGGQLFDYVKTTGRFEEPLSRYYFR